MPRASELEGAEYYLGIDPSITNTGVVLLDPYGHLIAFADGRNFVPRSCKGFERYIEQARGIEKFVSDNTEVGASIRCGYEGYSYCSEHRAFDLAEYGGVLKGTLLSRNGVTIDIIPPSTNKAFAVGTGSATKKMMMEQAAKEEPSLEGTSDDICDAYFLAKFVAALDGRRQWADESMIYRRAAAIKGYRDAKEDAGKDADKNLRVRVR